MSTFFPKTNPINQNLELSFTLKITNVVISWFSILEATLCSLGKVVHSANQLFCLAPLDCCYKCFFPKSKTDSQTVQLRLELEYLKKYNKYHVSLPKIRTLMKNQTAQLWLHWTAIVHCSQAPLSRAFGVYTCKTHASLDHMQNWTLYPCTLGLHFLCLGIKWVECHPFTFHFEIFVKMQSF